MVRTPNESTKPIYLSPLEEIESLRSLAEKCNLPFVDLSCATVDPRLLEKFPIQELNDERVLPLTLSGRRLTLAVGDPFKLESITRHPTFEKYELETVLADENQIVSQLKRGLGVGKQTINQLLEQQQPDTVHSTPLAVDENGEVEQTAANASISRFVDELLHEAIDQRASDVHIERDELGLRIRFRIDGMLRLQPIPRGADQFRLGIVSRLKIMAGLNIAEKRLPQDGHFGITYKGRAIDVRVSIMPMVHGEEVAMRLLDKSQVLFEIDRIGMPERSLSEWKRLIRKPHGMILVTGPTGSGKTTTLYASLRHIRSATTKIVTIEDPVEHSLAGINQIEIRENIGLSFSECLRRLLRHDPDVMLIGEIRDADTARNAVQASLTGHLVLSTLHANDSTTAYVRLVDMGIEPYLVASTVIGIASQRLVRRLCEECRQPYHPLAGELPDDFPAQSAADEGATIYRANGCRKCGSSGYSGRVALIELLVPDEGIRRLCLQKAAPSAVRAAAIERGMSTLRQSGWQRVLSGQTTIAEVLRVTEAQATETTKDAAPDFGVQTASTSHALSTKLARIDAFESDSV